MTKKKSRDRSRGSSRGRSRGSATELYRNIRLPKVSKAERELIKNAPFNQAGIHFGNRWYPSDTRQYDILKQLKKDLRCFTG